MNLALFDFDGTITTKDTFTDFLYFASSPIRIKLAKLILFSVILGYKFGIITPEKARQIAAYFAFKGRSFEELSGIGKTYSQTIIHNYLRSKAMDQIKWHKDQGDMVVVVSASLNIYLEVWCNTQDIHLICTQLEVKNNKATGKFLPTGCSGKEKVRRVKKQYDLENYNTIYAYGDTKEDNEMLQIADVKYFRWKAVSHLSKTGRWKKIKAEYV